VKWEKEEGENGIEIPKDMLGVNGRLYRKVWKKMFRCKLNRKWHGGMCIEAREKVSRPITQLRPT
jgi:hypothetical protein